MINIRMNVFETNSSSTHCLVLCTEEEYEKFEDGELFLDYWNNVLVTYDEAKEQDEHFPYNENDEKWFLTEEEYYDETDRYSHFHDCKDGIVAFGYYGYDG